MNSRCPARIRSRSRRVAYRLGTGLGTEVLGINDAGEIVGNYNDATGWHGFVYSGGAYTTLDDPSSTSAGTFARSINNNGQIVGEYGAGNVPHGFLLTITPTNPPPSAGTTADMILRRGDGMYEIYDIGSNAIRPSLITRSYSTCPPGSCGGEQTKLCLIERRAVWLAIGEPRA